MYYNSFQIFPRFKTERPIKCFFIFTVLVAPFVLSLCISALSLLLLALNQLAAICRPLFATSRLTPRHAVIATCMAWSLAAIAALSPGIIWVAFWPLEDCAKYSAQLSTKSIEVSAYSLVALIVIILLLYANIYRVVLKHRNYEPEVGRRNITNEQKGNYKAFITILLLTGSLVLFWLPYMLFHFASAHFFDLDNVSNALIYVKCYVIDFLPMLNFLADPIIYGLRMPEVRLGYRRLARTLCCGRFGTATRLSVDATKRCHQLRQSTAITGSMRLSSVYVCGGGSPRESQTMLMMTYVGNGRKTSHGLYPADRQDSD